LASICTESAISCMYLRDCCDMIHIGMCRIQSQVSTGILQRWLQRYKCDCRSNLKYEAKDTLWLTPELPINNDTHNKSQHKQRTPLSQQYQYHNTHIIHMYSTWCSPASCACLTRPLKSLALCANISLSSLSRASIWSHWGSEVSCRWILSGWVIDTPENGNKVVSCCG
jgi:hypothetical protein